MEREMIETVKEKVKALLASEEIRGFLGLRKANGHVGPHLFTRPEELDQMVLGDGEQPGQSRYPLNKSLLRLARAHPQERFGVLVRGCDERGLKTLFVWNQLNPQKVVPVGVACPSELAEACQCRRPFPDDCTAGEPGEGFPERTVETLDAMDLKERRAFWMGAFSRCIKCYGCRDVCPMCFCKECSLEEESLVQTGEIPPEVPLFHWIRAVHMAGRCIDCGLCEEACPADIPLRTLYKKVADILDEQFHYRPGYEPAGTPPLNLLGPSQEA